MNLSNFSSMHTHTVFCDGRNDIETLCRAAYEKKLYAIGFSAHAPIAKKTGIKTFWNLPDEKADEYVEEVLEAKKRWENKLKVFLGFEVDYIKGLRSPIDDDIVSYNPDFLIGAVHFIMPPNGAEPFTIDGSLEELENGIKNGFGGDADALMNYYYNANLELLSLGGFDILAHPDILKKCLPDSNTPLRVVQDKKSIILAGSRPPTCTPWNKETEFIRQNEVAEAVSKTGIVVEVNTGGMNRGKISETYPSPLFLCFLREHNVPVIITADAHRAEHLTGNYDTAVQTLIDANYKDHFIFTGRVDGKAQWQKFNLISN